jgi:hypothetical protein
MPLHVRITAPELLPKLVASFLRAECVAQAVERDRLVVIHPSADDSRQAHEEVAFFVRAWQLDHPGVGVELTHN